MTIAYPPSQRLAVIGLAGAGKTTLAHHLVPLFGLPHIELDAFCWAANWTRVQPECFRQRTIEALNRKRWLVEGNHCVVYDLIFAQAETLIWLDLPLPVMMQRLLVRTMSNLLNNTILSSGNREEWRRTFLTPDSIFLKLLKTYNPRRKAIQEQLKEPEYGHLHLIHLRSPQAVQRWRTEVSRSSGTGLPRQGRKYRLGICR